MAGQLGAVTRVWASHIFLFSVEPVLGCCSRSRSHASLMLECSAGHCSKVRACGRENARDRGNGRMKAPRRLARVHAPRVDRIAPGFGRYDRAGYDMVLFFCDFMPLGTRAWFACAFVCCDSYLVSLAHRRAICAHSPARVRDDPHDSFP